MRKIGLIVYPQFSAMTFAATSVFETANFHAGAPVYDVSVLSERGGPVATSLGTSVQTSPFARRSFDTLIIAGGITIPTGTPTLLRYLRAASRRTRRIASICTGASVLAEAGLLDGRRATTHWYDVPNMRQKYPQITVDDDRIFTADGPMWTSAGMSAGVDLALALVEDDLGPAIARDVAKFLVIYHRRAGGQPQSSAMLELDSPSDRVQTALAYAREHLDQPLSVRTLAKVVFLSPRQFGRLFKAETRESPAHAIERLRLESARAMIDAGRFSADEVAVKTGFGNRERMRRSFVRAFGQPPRALRRASMADRS